MGTPLQSMRLLLSPRNKLPSISPIRNVQSNKSYSSSRARKKLDYSFTSNTNYLKPNVQISIFGSPDKQNKNSLLVNTPNKYDILKSGLTSLRDLDILGKGSFGTVVRGSYAGKEVAVKVIKTKHSVKEQNALALNHENIVRTIDVIMKNESHSIIVMEYLQDAYVLQSIIDNENCKLPLGEIVRWVIDIVNGLIYCHSHQLLHLDLKPGNILVSNNICKICDFGNSCFVSSMDHIYEGTVQYTAPEILLGKPATYKCDTYSLGILMWQLRFRENPYKFLECRDSIIYNILLKETNFMHEHEQVVKYGLRPSVSSSGEEIVDDYSTVYKSCWDSDVQARPELYTVKNDLLNIENLL